jgi:hypothetical protein
MKIGRKDTRKKNALLLLHSARAAAQFLAIVFVLWVIVPSSSGQ